MKKWTRLLVGLSVVVFAAASLEAKIYLGQGSMVGEVDQTSAILQSRLTATSNLVEEDVRELLGGGPSVKVAMNPHTVTTLRLLEATE